MGFFNIFKKKVNDTDKLEQSINDFKKLWNTNDLTQIWKIEDKNDFIISLYGYLSKKCEYGDKIDNLLPHEKVIYFCQAFEGEINNGGFSQFFFNSTGDFTMETVDSLKIIGAVKTTKLLKKAVTLFPSGIVPKDRDKREEMLDELLNDENEELLSELDNSFYQYEDNLLELNYDYVLLNKSNFS